MASKKVSTLNALTSAGDDDLLYIADTSDSGASYASKRITVQNFLNGTASADGLAQEIADRTSGDTALSSRLDVLEADPTTATDVAAAIAVETAARQAADALALPLTGGTLTGDLELGSGGGGPATGTFSLPCIIDFGPNYENITVSITRSGALATVGTIYHSDGSHSGDEYGTWTHAINGVDISESTWTNGNAFSPGTRWASFGNNPTGSGTITVNSNESFTHYEPDASNYTYSNPTVHGGSGGATTIGTDGTATFGGAISASTVPTDDAHLVNKLYADNLVAGVDLSGIATNTAAIATETAARQAADTAEANARVAADALKLDLAGGTMTGAVNFGSGGGGGATLGWDTNNVDDSHGGPVEFSNNNRTITTGSIYDGAASTAVLPQTGKHYFELSFTDRNVILNISSTQAVSHWSGNTSELDNLYGFHIGNAGTYDASESDGLGDEMPNFNNIVNPHINTNPGPYLWGFAYDADAGTFSIYFENMLMYTITGIPTHDYYIHLTSIAANNPITINFAESDFAGNVPAGFASLESGGGGAASVIGVDGSASFGGNVTASAVPTDDAHLVNKLYADNLVAGVDLSGIATNAAAIEALTNGAPELLNTLAELGDALGDDENFATTVANQISAETTARTNADTALSNRLDTLEADPTTQTLLDAETAARQAADTAEANARAAADALLLPLAGGTMSGAINLGAGSSTYTSNVATTADSTGFSESFIFNGTVSDSVNFRFNSASAAHYVTFSPLTVTSSLRVHVDTSTSGISLNVDQGPSNTVNFTENNGDSNNDGAAWVTLPVTTPFTLTSIGRDAGHASWFYLGAIEVDGVLIEEGGTVGGGAASTLGVDGTATFGGAVSAATVPTADDHLVNKLYADSLVAGVDLSGIATNANAIAAETTARTNADTALSGRLDTLEADPTTQTLLDAETAARTAADALLLPLAGGTMSGNITFGGAGTSDLVNVDFTDAADASIFTVFQGSEHPVTTTDGGYAMLRRNNNSWASSYITLTTEIGTEYTLTTEVTLWDGAWFKVWIEHYAQPTASNTAIVSDQLNGNQTYSTTFTATSTSTVIWYQMPGTTDRVKVHSVLVQGAGVSTNAAVNADGTASFAGNITASAAPTDAAHLVNKLYADNLVAGVDLSGIATNAAAIEALTNGAPELLNTLNELANAIGDDENFATTVTNTIAAETTARTNADNALSGRLDTLEADPTTASALAAEANTRASADTALSNRLNTLEADPTTQTLLDAETAARTAADTAETNARTSADSALSGRLDSLEADATTQTLLDAETAARQAADALLLPLAGGTMTGAIALGSGGGGGATHSWDPNKLEESTGGAGSVILSNNDLTFTTATAWDGAAATVTIPTSGKFYWELASSTDAIVAAISSSPTITEYTAAAGNDDSYGLWLEYGQFYNGSNTNFGTIPGWSSTSFAKVAGFAFDADAGTLEIFVNGVSAKTFTGIPNKEYFIHASITRSNVSVTTQFAESDWSHSAPSGYSSLEGGGGASSTIGVDGTASFGGNVTASAVPTDDAHLVNKLYADNLVAGVDLSGIATNAAAIEALTNGAPDLLNTLNELANAIGDDENFATTVTNQISAETVARTNADNALSGRLDTLEADPTTGAALTAETVARTNADNALSGRLDSLEADSTTQTLLDAETTARTNADTLLSGRLDTLEADPTTASALASEATARANADTALSGRLDTLEADPTTATAVTNAIAVETAARIAGDALLLPLAGGTMTGDINLGASATIYTLTNTYNVRQVDYNQPEPVSQVVVSSQTPGNNTPRVSQIYNGAPNFDTITDSTGWQVISSTGAFAPGSGPENLFDGNQYSYVIPSENGATLTIIPPSPFTERIFFKGEGNESYAFHQGGGGGASVLGVDGTATFGSTVSAAAVPTADDHLVNKLYADNLVAGVDLSGIATNAAAIQALTNGAPELLNTLQELASALGDDANFSTTVTGQIAANEVHIDNAATLSGVAKDSTNLGAFTGSTISDTSNIKAALQALETAIETPSTASQIQTIEQTANGTFHVTFVDSNNGSATAESLFTDSGLTYNPSTDLLSGGSIDMTTLLLDGVEVTATGAELNFLGGLTSAVQTQLDGKVTTGANINTLVGDTTAGDVPVDINGTDNYLFLVIDKANGALTAIDKTFLEAE